MDAGWKEESLEETFSFLEAIQPPQIEMPEPPQETPEPLEMLEPREIPPAISPAPEPIKISEAKPPLPWKKILIGVACVLFVGGAVFGGYYYYSKRPLMIIGKVLDKIPEIKSFQADSELKIQFDNQTLEAFKQMQELTAANQEYVLQSKTKVDFTDSGNVKLTAEISSNEALSGELKLVNNALYGKLNKADSILDPYFKPGDIEEVQAMYEVFKSVLTDKWVKLFDINSSQIAPNQAVVEGICQSIKSHPKVIKKITKTTGSDTAYGYRLEIDKNEVAVMMADITGQGQELESLKGLINQNLNISDVEIWVGKKTYLIEKLSIDFSLNIKGLGLIETEGEQIMTVQYDGSFADYNQALAVQAPETFSTPEAVMTEYNTAILQSPLYQIALKDREIISNMEALKESALSFKTQKGTYVSFEKTSAFVAPWRTINRQGGAPLVMYYLQDKFCIQKELLSSKYYCVDYTGYSGSDAYCDKTSCDCKK